MRIWRVYRFRIKLSWMRNGNSIPLPSLPPKSLTVDPLLSPVATMNNDKGSFSDPNGVDQRTSGGHGPLSAHTYVQNPSPLRTLGNPGPL